MTKHVECKIESIVLFMNEYICFYTKEPPHLDCLYVYRKEYLVWECSGSVVECMTRDLEAAGSSIIGVTALWSLSKTHLS